MRGLPRHDAFPADDVGVRRFIAQFYRKGEKTSYMEARAIAYVGEPGKDLPHIISKSQTCSGSTPIISKIYEKHYSTNEPNAAGSPCSWFRKKRDIPVYIFLK